MVLMFVRKKEILNYLLYEEFMIIDVLNEGRSTADLILLPHF